MQYKTSGLLTYTFRLNNVATNATTLTVQIYKPDGTALWGSAQTPTNTGTGTYTQDITAVEADTIGRWTAKWIGTYGSSSHTDIEEFWVTGDVEPVSYVGLCTLEQVKNAVGIDSTSDDVRIADLIMSATKTICNKYEREFVPQSSTVRTFRVDKNLVDLAPYDLRSVSLVRLHPEATSPTTLTASTDYCLLPIGGDSYNSIRLGTGVTLESDFSDDFGFSQLEVTGTWGIWASESEVPEDVNRAAVVTVLSWLDRPVAQIAAVDLGDPRQMLPSGGGTWAIPNAAHEVFRRYARMRMYA